MLFELGSISLSQNESINLLKLCSCPVTNKDDVGITSAELVEITGWTSAVLHAQIFVSVEFAALWSLTSARTKKHDLFLLFYLPNTPSLAQTPTAEVAIFSSCLPKRLMAGQAMSLSQNGQIWHQDWQWKVGPTSTWHIYGIWPAFCKASYVHWSSNWPRTDKHAFGCSWMRQWIGWVGKNL